jgi:hypothetical protein
MTLERVQISHKRIQRQAVSAYVVLLLVLAQRPTRCRRRRRRRADG